jgi:hypothetical protein
MLKPTDAFLAYKINFPQTVCIDSSTSSKESDSLSRYESFTLSQLSSESNIATEEWPIAEKLFKGVSISVDENDDKIID